MPQQCRAVKLTKAERGKLERFVAHGKRSVRAITRARILLLSDEGRKERELTEVLGVSRGTVYNVRKKYQRKAHAHILELLHEEPRSGRPIKLDGRVEANVTMIACSDIVNLFALRQCQGKKEAISSLASPQAARVGVVISCQIWNLFLSS
jgi:transposase